MNHRPLPSSFSSPLPAAAGAGRLPLQKALAAIRQHLGMDVAYLSQIVGDDSVFEIIDAPGLEEIVKVGDRRSLDDVYCRHILEGRLPELMPDTSLVPLAADMPITSAVPIGAHMSLPVRLPDGSVYGMFCCLSAAPNPSLNARDLGTMRLFAELAAERVGETVEAERSLSAKRTRILERTDGTGFDLALQPICDLGTGATVGFESLSRFASDPYRPPNVWFDEAAEVGLGAELEVAAIRKALAYAEQLPDTVYVSINASPETVLSDTFAEVFATAGAPSRLMLEITEHARVAAYEELHAALAPLRGRGVQLAVDDAGAGYASLSHILQLRPDAIKLDQSLVENVDHDPARHALASGMAMFARELGILVVAEGIETEAERDALRGIGIEKGQGYFLDRPAPAGEVVAGFGRTGSVAA